jgi:hypothetical protein
VSFIGWESEVGVRYLRDMNGVTERDWWIRAGRQRRGRGTVSDPGDGAMGFYESSLVRGPCRRRRCWRTVSHVGIGLNKRRRQ